MRLLLLALSCMIMVSPPAPAAPVPSEPVQPPVPGPGEARAFEIGEKEFLLDGRPFVIRCGEIHSARVPREYWRHRLQMCRALGLNTVCLYLFWNFHEWEEGRFDWSGRADVDEFCRLAQEEGLWVILRPGPYSCAEWEMGGLPWWLLRREGIQLRSRDPGFTGPATRFLKEVGRVLAPRQVTRGGPLLMVQVENEYGSYGDDAGYMGIMRQALIDGGFDVPLFSCDPVWALSRGNPPGLFKVVNFGQGAAEKAFTALAKLQDRGPLMNGEYYPAWFDMWGRRHHTGEPGPIAADLDYMLKNRHSFSIYMAHGGTSFELWAGADRPFRPDTSSYDYDAPISEAGWVTPKFEAIRAVMARHLQPGETIPAPPPPNPVVRIEPFTLAQTAPITPRAPKITRATEPPTMESIGQGRGYMLYRAKLPAGPAGHLEAGAVHDFAWVKIDGKPAGVMDRRAQRHRVPVPARAREAEVELLLVTMGRVNFGVEVHDRKGIHGGVRFIPDGGDAQPVLDWTVVSLPLDQAHLDGLDFGPSTSPEGAAFWKGEFSVQSPGDTFLDMREWGKGVVWVNGRCLGRFWNIGPTQTMYLPGPWLKAGRNEVIVLDLLGPKSPRLAGLDKPILDELRAGLDFSRSPRATGKISTDGLAPVASARLNPDPGAQEVKFPAARGRYLAIAVTSTHDGSPQAALAEMDLIDDAGGTLSKSACRILWVDSEELNAIPGAAENVLDGQPSSYWQAASPAAPLPRHLVIDLGREETISGLRFIQRGGGKDPLGRPKDCEIYLSETPFGLTLPD